MVGMSPLLGIKKQILSKTQKDTLMEKLQANLYPGKEEVRQLAMSFNIGERTIANKLSKLRQKKVSEGTPSQREYIFQHNSINITHVHIINYPYLIKYADMHTHTIKPVFVSACLYILVIINQTNAKCTAK